MLQPNRSRTSSTVERSVSYPAASSTICLSCNRKSSEQRPEVLEKKSGSDERPHPSASRLPLPRLLITYKSPYLHQHFLSPWQCEWKV